MNAREQIETEIRRLARSIGCDVILVKASTHEDRMAAAKRKQEMEEQERGRRPY